MTLRESLVAIADEDQRAFVLVLSRSINDLRVMDSVCDELDMNREALDDLLERVILPLSEMAEIEAGWYADAKHE